MGKKTTTTTKRKTRRPSSVIFLDKEDRRVLSIEQVGNVCPKIKLPSEKTPFLRVFRATKTRSKRGGRTRATGRSPRLLRAWIRSPERNRKKYNDFFAGWISQTNLRGRCRWGRGKARRGSSCEFLSTCFFPRLRLPCRLNNTEFNSSIYMAILRTTLSDIRTWPKKVVFPPRAPSVRSKSAISIPYKSNRRLLRDQTRRQTALSFPTSGLSGEAASNEVFKEAHKRFTYNREFPFHWNGNFKKYNKTSAGVLFPLYAPISPPFLSLICLTFLLRSPRGALRKEGRSLAF